MEIQESIRLDEFRKTVEELANETKAEFPNLYFDYAGVIPVKGEKIRYDSSPINADIFATTGGDGVHYSILEISEKVQPVVMTVPMNFGNSMKGYNWIIGENLNEFLAIGYYNGWFPIEQLCYNNEWAIDFYSKENMEEDFQNGPDIQFIKKLRKRFGYKHIALNNKRLKELELKYFGKLVFNSEFVEKYIKI